jgi:CMP-N-acetylneuraminic acid synthetase
MIYNKTILAVIPARGGSKGIPRKNLHRICGNPMIYYTILAANKSQYIDKVIVSTEDTEIAVISMACGADVIQRPVELAQDDTETTPVIEHAINHLRQDGKEYDLVICLQPTSPLRTEKHIDEAIEKFHNSEAKSLISVNQGYSWFLKAFVRDGEYMRGIVNNQYPFMRRQDLPYLYLPNGAIYINNVQDVLETKSMSTDKILPYVMDGVYGIDVDDNDDVYATEQIMQELNQANK